MLDDTIVIWTTEFGRMPCSQGGAGRDHNPFGFTSWMAGGGIKGGTTYGETDEWSYKAAGERNLLATTSTPPCSTCSASTTAAQRPQQRHRPPPHGRSRA
jgi:uncharacterized protein (DUF1501 family)